MHLEQLNTQGGTKVGLELWVHKAQFILVLLFIYYFSYKQLQTCLCPALVLCADGSQSLLQLCWRHGKKPTWEQQTEKCHRGCKHGFPLVSWVKAPLLYFLYHTRLREKRLTCKKTNTNFFINQLLFNICIHSTNIYVFILHRYETLLCENTTCVIFFISVEYRKCYKFQGIPENLTTNTIISFKAEAILNYSLYARCLAIQLQWVNACNLHLKEFPSQP